MATALGSQLKALAQGRGLTPSSRPRSRPSLLFEPREAADIDLSTIFSLAEAGLEELALLENGAALEAYKATLFSTQSMQTDREVQGREFNEQLNQSIACFLHLLSGSVLLPACHQVMEYLIRRYKIHIYNVEDIMLTILPYHETTVFVRIVQLLQLEKTRWEVFLGVKASGAPPPRPVLVQKCLRDLAFLEAVCDSGMLAMEPTVKSRVHATFSSVLVMETLSATPAISTDIVRKVLPFIQRSLGQDVVDEFWIGGLIVVGAMAKRAVLAPQVTCTLFQTLCALARKLKEGSAVRLVLLTLVELAQTQDMETVSSKKGWKALLKVRGLFFMLSDLSKKYNAQKLISLLLNFIAAHCDECESDLLAAIDTFALGNHIEAIVQRLMKAAAVKDGQPISSDIRGRMTRILTAIEKRFPHELDECIGRHFQEKEKKENCSFTSLLEDIFHKSLRRPLSGFGSTLYTSIDHPEADVRAAAVSSLSDLVNQHLDSEVKEFVRSALIRRLGDDNLNVVLTVLSLSGLEKLVPSDKLADAVSALIHRCMDPPERGRREDVRQVINKCIELVGSLLNIDAKTMNLLQPTVLCYCQLGRKTWKLNMLFLKASIQFPLLRSIAQAVNEYPDESMSKEELSDWRASRNKSIVEVISSTVSRDDSMLDLLFEASRISRSAKTITAFVLLIIFPGYEGSKHRQCYDFLKNEWISIREQLPLERLLEVDYGSEHDVLSMHKELETEGMVAYAKAVLVALWKVITKLLPSDELANDMFIVFSQSPWKLFKSHLNVLLERLWPHALSFLMKFILPGESAVSTNVQVFSLQVLAASYDGLLPVLEDKLEIRVLSVVSVLSDRHKSVRRNAIACIRSLVKSTAMPLEDEVPRQFLHLILDNEESFIENRSYLWSFCNNVLSEQSRDPCKPLVMYILQQGVHLPPTSQATIYKALTDIGYVSEKASATQNMLFQLLQRRRLYHFVAGTSSQLGVTEVELRVLLILLEFNLKNVNHSLEGENHALWALHQCLDVSGGSLKDPVIVQPCLKVLEALTPDLYAKLDFRSQGMIFSALIVLNSLPDESVRLVTQPILDSLAISVSTLADIFDSMVGASSKNKNKRIKLSNTSCAKWPVTAIMSFLDYLMRGTEKNAWAGEQLLDPVFGLFRGRVDGTWPAKEIEISPKDAEFLDQRVLSVLENLILSIPKEGVTLDVDFLVEFVINAQAATTRKHALAVVTAVAKQHPECVWKHVINIFTVVGTSTVTLDDTYSHKVIQDLLEAVIPFWLGIVKDAKSLLQIFVEALPRIPERRQVELMKCVMRVTNEETSIPELLLLLIRQSATVDTQGGPNWAINFAQNFCTSYAPNRRASTLMKLSSLSTSGCKDASFWDTLRDVTNFIVRQFQALRIQNLEERLALDVCHALMRDALRQSQILSEKTLASSVPKTCLEASQRMLDTVVSSMTPQLYCKAVNLQLQDFDDLLCRKVLHIYVSKLKAAGLVLRKTGSQDNFASDAKPHLELVTPLLDSLGRSASSRTRQTIVSAIGLLAEMFGENASATLVSALPALVANFRSSNVALAAASIRCAASILSKAGVGGGLSNLPVVMSGLLAVPQQTQEEDTDVRQAVLGALECLVDKMSGFLSPYIEDIVSLLVLQPDYFKSSGALRSLISKKVPARLLFDPLSKIYKKALSRSDRCVAGVFDMLGAMSSALDRPSVTAFHARIFSFCMEALDLRRKRPESISEVHVVEESVISAILSLVMKLSEATFKPLFVFVHGWTGSTTLESEDIGGPSLERAIVFFKLVNQLTEKLRSVFVPYFRYLLDECVLRLGGEDAVPKKPKKKAKLEKNAAASIPKWHLEQLIVSALHKCFLYDTVSFLDGPKFQKILVPLTRQLIADVPAELKELKQSDVPTEEQADKAIVECLVRMAITAGSDLYWKPLNHEVLMHTRRESVRAKRLALQIVKSLAENLKEEYLVLIAETLPFLAELLEDKELTIVSQTQEVIKFLEELSGESLTQYL